eukprot:1852767-Amphidinium_carterae.1
MSKSTVLHATRNLQWRLLMLNTHFRWQLQSVLDTRLSPDLRVPRIAAIVSPGHTALFLVPILEQAWGGSLDLSLLYIGSSWSGHEKCADCAQAYETRYPVEVVPSIPYND